MNIWLEDEKTEIANSFIEDKEKCEIIRALECNLPYMRETDVYDDIIDKLRNNADWLTEREMHLIDAILVPLVSQSFNQPAFLKWETIRYKLIQEILRRNI